MYRPIFVEGGGRLGFTVL